MSAETSLMQTTQPSSRESSAVAPPPGSRDRRLVQTLAFLLLSTAVTLALFWPAVTGQKLLAPLDIAPNLFAKFRYVDPAARGVPANHYVIDLMFSDLSRNFLVHEAWRAGEMPWWDPYTEGGRPLAAESNAVNISDPIKVLLFHWLPFTAAYNWIRILPFILSGVFAFCLWRHFGFGVAPSVWGGLLYQFAGCNFIMFSGPTVQATFAYYPLVWLLWDRAIAERKSFWFLLSVPVVALVFLSGNLQSHSYLFLFALAFTLGYGWRQRARWPALLLGIGATLTAGLGLAAPFVFSQIELALFSPRPMHGPISPAALFSGVGSLAAFFPWMLGTFRTLDLSKVFDQSGLGFWIYIGSAALVIAGIGVFAQVRPGSREADVKRTAFALIVAYFVACSTPLIYVLYTRTAWLAVLGVLVLFGLGWRRLAAAGAPWKRTGWCVIVAAFTIAVSVNVGGHLIYPRFQDRVEKRLLEKQKQGGRLDEATALRQFQLANLANEVTFKNPEIVVTVLGLFSLGAFLLRPPARRFAALHGILILSTFPLLWFGHRYTPMQPMEFWERLRAGGPEQRRIQAATQRGGWRLFEVADGPHELAFPGALAQLFRVHVLHGYCSLVIPNASLLRKQQGEIDPAWYDYSYRSPIRGMESGELARRAGGASARFHWRAPNSREVSILAETLTTITLAIAPGPPGDLLRTDTYFPGWRVVAPDAIQLKPVPPCFAEMHVPAEVTRLTLKYEPRWWRAGLGVAAGSVALLFAWAMAAFHRRSRLDAPVLSQT